MRAVYESVAFAQPGLKAMWINDPVLDGTDTRRKHQQRVLVVLARTHTYMQEVIL
jgi:hypothetical protein